MSRQCVLVPTGVAAQATSLKELELTRALEQVAHDHGAGHALAQLERYQDAETQLREELAAFPRNLPAYAALAAVSTERRCAFRWRTAASTKRATTWAVSGSSRSRSMSSSLRIMFRILS